MAKKQHLSSLAAPRSWKIPRKGRKWIAKPIPGTHNMETAMPLVVMVRDVLGLVEKSKDIKKMIHTKDILVNQKVPKDVRFPIGVFDVLSFPKAKLHYRIIFSKNGKLSLTEIKQSEANLLPVKLVNKTTVRGGKSQLNLSNGWNLLVAKDMYKINDVIVLDLNSRKVNEHIKFEPGKEVYVVAGKRLGSTGKLKEVKQVGLLKRENIAVLEFEGTSFETKAEYLFVKK